MMKIILVGYSGHAYVVADAAECSGLIVNYYSDKQEAKKNPYGLKYLGFEGDESFIGWKEDYQFILGIGDNILRQKIAANIEKHNKTLISIIHPSAILAKNVKVGEGVFVAPNVAINPMARIGNYVILNTSSVIEHECVIEDGAHVAPGAVLAGNVRIGRNTFIGANSVIKQGINIGENVVVGVGSTVVKDIPDNQVWIGNPAKLLNK